MERRLEIIESLFRRLERERRPAPPSVDIDAIPRDQEIVLFEPEQLRAPSKYPLPNPFIVGFQTEDIRK